MEKVAQFLESTGLQKNSGFQVRKLPYSVKVTYKLIQKLEVLDL